MKDEVTALRVIGQTGQEYIIMATKKGSIQLYQAVSGALISEIESAHYLAINDLAVHEDLVVTGGKDTKTRVWILGDLLCHSRNPCRHYHEFGEAQMEIT